MSQENVEAVRRLYGDPRGLAAATADVLAPDGEFDFTAVYPDMPTMRSAAELRRFRDSGPWAGSAIHIEPERFFDVDEARVLVFVRISATGQGSGAPVEIRGAHEFTFVDGRLVRLKAYRDRDEARRALGMNDPR